MYKLGNGRGCYARMTSNWAIRGGVRIVEDKRGNGEK